MSNDLKADIKGLILDMDGVLWRDMEPIGDLPAIFNKTAEAGLKVLFATNNTTRTPEEYKEKLAHFGVNVSADQIITSGLATVYVLQKKFPQGANVFLVGPEALRQALEQGGFTCTDQNVQAVVVGMDRDLNYTKLSKATLFIRAGADFIGSNPDTTFPTPEGLVPGTGSIIALIESATSQKPFFAGKPYPTMMNMAFEKSGLLPHEMLVIGDRLNTDILFGQESKCRTGVVLSGVSTQEEINQWTPKPDFIGQNLEAILNELI